jgi:hypothetical protein
LEWDSRQPRRVRRLGCYAVPILRSSYHLQETDSKYFTIVGDCYIHDFIQGEMMEEKRSLKKKIGMTHII